MVLKSVLPILGLATLQTGLMCSPGLAATRTASISVSATVVAGCQVSPVLWAAKSAVSESKSWETSVSMSCTLPVPYQVSVANSAQIDAAAPSSNSSNLSGSSPYVRTYSLGLFLRSDWPGDSAEEPNHGLDGLLSAGLPADSIEAGDRIFKVAYPETITVTVIY